MSATNAVSTTPDIRIRKFANGQKARDAWSKSITANNSMTIQQYNHLCNNSFKPAALINLDDCARRQTTLKAVPCNKTAWAAKKEFVYIITRNDVIMKIGGTRTGMKARWGSYCCGHCVPQRNKKGGEPFPGKMSVTNAHLYHTIENDLINTGATWAFYNWELPIIILPVNILGDTVNVIAQTFHAYEAVCINKFKNKTNKIPLLCNNCDPNYSA